MISKIARLPRRIREQLNRRIDDGQPAGEILPWLNRLAAVRKVLKAQFGSVPVSKQNLTDWRNGGFREWLSHRDALDLAWQIAVEAAELNDATRFGEGDLEDFTEKMSQWFAARYLVMAKALVTSVENEDPEEQEAPMRRICRDLVAMRRADHSAGRLQIERERFEMEKQQSRREKEKEKEFWAWTHEPAIYEKILNREKEEDEKIRRVFEMVFGKPPKHMEEAARGMRPTPPPDNQHLARNDSSSNTDGLNIEVPDGTSGVERATGPSLQRAEQGYAQSCTVKVQQSNFEPG